MKSFEEFKESRENYKIAVSSFVKPNVDSVFNHIKSDLRPDADKEKIMNLLLGLAFKAYDKGMAQAH